MNGLGKPGLKENHSSVPDGKLLTGETKRLAVLLIIFIVVLQCVICGYYVTNQFTDAKQDVIPGEIVIRRPNLERSIDIRNRHRIPLSPSSAVFRFTEPDTINVPDHLSPVLLLTLHDLSSIELSEKAPAVQVQKVNTGSSGFDYSVNRVPLSPPSARDELIRIKDLNNGTRKGMIYRHPLHKQKVEGFISIPTVWGTQLKPPDELKGSVIGLVEAVKGYTGLDAELDTHLTLDSRRLHRLPFVYITTDHAFELTKTERTNFGDYLKNGGFAVLDNGAPGYERSQAESSLRQMMRDTLGCHARFLPIPENHPLYHCFFDFDDGPPQGAEATIIITQTSDG
ncbi:DUF4159 domain-containing protein [Candidatus Latescibacterota bacterium]